MNNIEDAIKRCKEIISKCDDCKFATCEQCEINWTDIQAIKIILGNLEALADMQKTADRELENAKKINEEHKKENGELREKVKELEEYIFIAPNLDEMTATKYTNIQREAYFRGRAEEQQKAEQIIYENYIPKQKIKDKIEEIEKEENLYAKTNIIKVLQELLQESEDYK